MFKTKILNCVQGIAISLGISGAALVFIGTGSFVLGTSGQVINKLGQALEPHKSTMKHMAIYGIGTTFTGLIFAGSGVAVAWKITDKLQDEEIDKLIAQVEQERSERIQKAIEQLEQQGKHHCIGCIYYSPNSYLSCAVNPGLPNDCVDYASY